MSLPRRLIWPGLCGLATSLPACGGGAPLLHPAHPLPAQRVTAGAGLSATFSFENESGGSQAQPGALGTPGAEEAALEGAVAETALSPGVAPWVGARVGLGWDSEAGVTYTGRSVRMDARRVFATETLALSLGAGASAVLLRSTEDARTGATGERLAPRSGDPSYGLDVPIVVGLRSSASVVEAWAGIRGGVEWLHGELTLAAADPAGREGIAVDASRFHAGGLVGFSVGLRPFSVAVELDVAYQSMSADGAFPREGAALVRRSTSLTGLTLSPAAAIIGKF